MLFRFGTRSIKVCVCGENCGAYGCVVCVLFAEVRACMTYRIGNCY